MKTFIEKLLAEWSYRTREGYPVVTNKEHIRVLSEILDEWNLDEIKTELIQNLLSEEDEEEKRFDHSVLNKKLTYKTVDGEDAEDLVGNLIRRPDDEDAHIQAKSYLDKLSDEDRKEAMDALGSEGQPDRDIESEREEDSDEASDDDTEDGDSEFGGSDMFEPNTPSGDSYLNTLPDGDPAKPEELKDTDNEDINENVLLEGAFNAAKLADVRYRTQWLDNIKNGLPFELEKQDREVVIDKSFLKSTGLGNKTLEQILKNGNKADFEAFFTNERGNYPQIIPATDGKKYKLNDFSKSTFTGQGGGKKSSGGNKIPSDPEYYERGICVEYNKLQGMDRGQAIKAAEVDVADYEKYEAHLTEVCSKIVSNLKGMGSKMVWWGARSILPASVWPSPNKTPKTDIFGGTPYRISLKKAKGSQLVSGGPRDASGLFMGGLKFYEAHEWSDMKQNIDDILNDIETGFKSYNTENSVTTVRNTATDAYVQWRTPEIAKQSKAKKSDIERHAKAEAMGLGISGERGSWQNWFIDGVDKLKDSDIMKWFDDYWKTQGTEELQNEMRDIIGSAIEHKKITEKINKALDDVNFKKWVIYEAASGNFKFSGDSDLGSSNDAIANKLVKFDLNGSVQIADIDANWSVQYAPKVKTLVVFKSSGKNKRAVLRGITMESTQPQTNDFQSDLANIINEETERLYETINETIELHNDLLLEIDFKKAWSNVKSIASKLMNRIVNSIKKFYHNVIKKAIDKLKEWARDGLTKFLEYLGIEMDGKCEFSIDF